MHVDKGRGLFQLCGGLEAGFEPVIAVAVRESFGASYTRIARQMSRHFLVNSQGCPRFPVGAVIGEGRLRLGFAPELTAWYWRVEVDRSGLRVA